MLLIRERASLNKISRVAGIEPTQTVLKTVVLPLNYTPLRVSLKHYLK